MDEIKVKQLKNPSLKVGNIDTASPFDSVNEAVSMFGAIVNRKAHNVLTTEKHVDVDQLLENTNDEIALTKNKFEAVEEAKLRVFQELDGTKRLIEELTLNLERAETEECEAKQDSELVAAAVAELTTVKNELESVHKDYGLLVSEKDIAVKRARDAVSSSKDVEKQVENLTIQLNMTKGSLESTHAAYLEAEKHKNEAVIAREQDALNWKQELKQVQEEIERINQQINAAEYQKSKLETATSLLHDLKTELAAYNELDLTRKKNVEAVKENITKAIEKIDYLKTTANSLKTEVEREKAALAATRRQQGMAVAVVASLEAELNQTRSEIARVRSKEKEAREQMVAQLQKAAREADQAKSRAQEARDEVKKAKETVEQTKALEKLALAAIDACHKPENRSENKQEVGVTVSLEEYYELSTKAHEADEAAQKRVAKVMSLIDVAKESESKILTKFDQLTLELAARKQAFNAALQKAEKANQRKLVVEQDLRNWRVERGQRRRSGLRVGRREDFEEV